jgi:hypothetical protein
LLMDWDGMSNIYRGPSLDASCQVWRKYLWKPSVAIAFVVLIRKQPWPPQAILVSDWPIFKNLLGYRRKEFFKDQSETRIAHGGHVC